MSKKCTKCGINKPVNRYFKDNSKIDGLYSSCKDCSYKQSAISRRKYLDSARTRLIKWRNKNRDYVNEYRRKAYKSNRHKDLARRAVQYAVQTGRLSKSSNCQDCGSQFFVQAHHTDYSKPLEVTWLCRKCHGIIHRRVYVG